MTNKKKISPLSTALGASFTISLTVSPAALATENPFEVTSLESGYMVADAHVVKVSVVKVSVVKVSVVKVSVGVKKPKFQGLKFA